jgi:hypothetical protein
MWLRSWPTATSFPLPELAAFSRAGPHRPARDARPLTPYPAASYWQRLFSLIVFGLFSEFL